jgi:hypothetical protein
LLQRVATGAVVVVGALAFIGAIAAWIGYLMGNPPLNDAVMRVSFAVPYPLGVVVYMLATAFFFLLLPAAAAAGVAAGFLWLLGAPARMPWTRG